MGVLLTCDLTWSSHTQMVCNKARKILGVVHRRFYNTPASTLFQLYLSIVRPHLEYASPVWSLHLAKDKELVNWGCAEVHVESCKQDNWTMTHHDLLDQFNLPTLEICRCEASLTILFKIIYKINFFLIIYLSTCPQLSTITYITLLFSLPFTRTNSFTYSFVPYTITLWNNLGYATVSAPSIQSFKYLL